MVDSLSFKNVYLGYIHPDLEFGERPGVELLSVRLGETTQDPPACPQSSTLLHASP